MSPPRPSPPRAHYDLVAVGASLGGVTALRVLLAGLPAGFPAPLAIVQHRGPDGGGLDGDSALPAVLAEGSNLPILEPTDREPLRAGVVYLAPAGYHMLVEPGFLTLSIEEPVSFARPSIDVLFETAAEAYGRRLVAVLLTCSSEDGAAGMAAVARRGGLTMVEDPVSAHSPVAARSALALTAVHHVLPLERIAGVLAAMAVPVEGRT